MAALGPGQILDGKYAIKRVLGEGGMGVVYEAHHTGLDQPVAIKLMLPDLLSEKTLVARFEREARAAAKLKSRYVARVFDVDITPDGLPYIVMELLEGHDLAYAIADAKQLPVGQAVHVLLQVCVAIDAAHRAGIVHRDLKPANVFLAKEGDSVVAKVLDFGISKDLVANTRLTSENGVVGTVLYMSPEQVRNDPVDHRTDIWSLGAVLYEALAGIPPFDGTVTQVAAAIVSQQPASLSSLRPDLPAGLATVINRMLAKDANSRYPDVASLMAALAPFAPTQDLAPYLEVTTSVRTPSNPRVDVADTLDAPDRVIAPAVATNAGLSSERLLPRRSPRGRLLVAALMVAIPVGAFAFVLTRPPASGARIEPALVPAASTSTSSSAPSSAPSSEPTPANVVPGATPAASGALVTTPQAEVDAGAAIGASSKPHRRPPKGAQPSRTTPPPSPPPAPPSKGPVPPFHL